MKSKSTLALLGLMTLTSSANAYPLISTFAETANGRVMFYQDHLNPSKYWYFSNAIDPVPNLDGSVSRPVIRPNYLYYAYSGQAQVRKEDLVEFADQKKIKITDLSPIPFEKTTSTACMNVDASMVTIQIPPRVGAYLEHLPVTVSTRDPESVDILKEALQNGSGVNCYASVTYKVAADEHIIRYEVAMNDVYSQFQAAAGANGWLWEVDVRTNLKSFTRNGMVKIYEYKDGDTSQPAVAIDPNDGKKSTEDMMMAVFELVIKQLFDRKTKIPDEAGLPGPSKGKLYSLRAGYTRSSEQFGFKGEYQLQGTRLHESSIQIRVAPPKI